MLKIRKFNQAGDTILEVLIAVAVLSLILTTSFTLANRSSQATRQAAERGEASKWAQSEIEELKYFLSTNATGIPVAGYFCIDTPAAPSLATPTIVTVPGGNINDPTVFNVIPDKCRQGTDKRYATFINRDTATPNTYTAYVRWDSVTGHGPDKIDLIHRVYPDTAANITTITNGSPINFTAPTVVVTGNIVASADCYAPGDPDGGLNQGCPVMHAVLKWSSGPDDIIDVTISSRYNLGQRQTVPYSYTKPLGTTLLSLVVNMTTDKCAAVCSGTSVDRNLYIHSYSASGQGTFSNFSADPTRSPGICAPLLGYYIGTDGAWLCSTGIATFVPSEPSFNNLYNFESCIFTDQFVGDNVIYDYCQLNGAAQYLRRNGLINYRTTSTLPGPSYAKVQIGYQQWPGSVVSATYPGYDVFYWINGAPKYFARLPLSTTPATYTGLIPIPSSSSTDFHIQWMNNDGSYGGDPDLQINSIRILRP